MNYFGENESFGGYAEYERVLTEGELTGTLGTLPDDVLFHQIDMIQRAVVELAVRNQWRATLVVRRIFK